METLILASLLGLAALAALVALFGYIVYRAMIYYRMRDEAYQRQAGIEAGDFDASVFDLPWIEANVASMGGYALRVHALEPDAAAADAIDLGSGRSEDGRFGSNIRNSYNGEGRSARKLAVFHHGIGWGWLGMIRYMELFRAEGWTVVAYDARGHGSTRGASGSRPARPSYGYFEKNDLRTVVDWSIARFVGAAAGGGGAAIGVATFDGAASGAGNTLNSYTDSNAAVSPGAGRSVDMRNTHISTTAAATSRGRPFLAIFGESMGAATALQYAPLDPRVDAVIADCPFSSAKNELDYQLGRALVPPGLRQLVVSAADAFCRRLEGFSLREADPARAVLETDVPILFIHGLEDRFVPWRMSVAMAERRRRALPDAVTELLLVPGARHGASERTDRERYVEALREFLGKAGRGA
jgi:pimeloyl-ACP methyl ester carboxylesterase